MSTNDTPQNLNPTYETRPSTRIWSLSRIPSQSGRVHPGQTPCEAILVRTFYTSSRHAADAARTVASWPPSEVACDPAALAVRHGAGQASRTGRRPHLVSVVAPRQPYVDDNQRGLHRGPGRHDRAGCGHHPPRRHRHEQGGRAGQGRSAGVGLHLDRHGHPDELVTGEGDALGARSAGSLVDGNGLNDDVGVAEQQIVVLEWNAEVHSAVLHVFHGLRHNLNLFWHWWCISKYPKKGLGVIRRKD